LTDRPVVRLLNLAIRNLGSLSSLTNGSQMSSHTNATSTIDTSPESRLNSTVHGHASPRLSTSQSAAWWLSIYTGGDEIGTPIASLPCICSGWSSLQRRHQDGLEERVAFHMSRPHGKRIVLRTECTNHLYYTAVPCTCSYRRTGSARTRTEVARKIYALDGEQTVNAAPTGGVCSCHRAKARIIICPAKRQPKKNKKTSKLSPASSSMLATVGGRGGGLGKRCICGRWRTDAA
jgi:hypothetical protein